MSYDSIIGSSRQHFDQIDSTNEEAKRLLQSQKVQEGLIITADYQTSGRGQYGRIWNSSSGQNLMLSIILYPTFVKVIDQFNLNMAYSLAVAQTVYEYCDDVSVKWPNDIYVRDKKVAGILIENFIQADKIKTSIIGIGLNVNQESWPDDVPNAASICQFVNEDIQVKDVLQKLINAFNLNYEQLKLNPAELKVTYLNHLYRLGENCVFLVQDSNINGVIRGIDQNGRLLVEQNDGLNAYDHGSIQMQI